MAQYELLYNRKSEQKETTQQHISSICADQENLGSVDAPEKLKGQRAPAEVQPSQEHLAIRNVILKAKEITRLSLFPPCPTNQNTSKHDHPQKHQLERQ